jgi:ribosome-binding protein aMBF1 (putative translation factor)
MLLNATHRTACAESEFIEPEVAPTPEQKDSKNQSENQQALLEKLDTLVNQCNDTMSHILKIQKEFMTLTRQVLEGRTDGWSEKQLASKLKKIEEIHKRLQALNV